MAFYLLLVILRNQRTFVVSREGKTPMCREITRPAPEDGQPIAAHLQRIARCEKETGAEKGRNLYQLQAKEEDQERPFDRQGHPRRRG